MLDREPLPAQECLVLRKRKLAVGQSSIPDLPDSLPSVTLELKGGKIKGMAGDTAVDK